MKPIDGYMYCDHYGAVHEDKPDPEYEGPRDPDYEEKFLRGEPGWELRVEPEYGKGKLWFFTCPGPHYKVYTRGIK